MSQLDLSPIDTNKYEDQEPQRLSEINLKETSGNPKPYLLTISTIFLSSVRGVFKNFFLAGVL